MTDNDVAGPIDFLILEFPGDRLNGEAGAALFDLVDAGIVRVLDLLIVTKDSDGTVAGIDIQDLDADHLGSFAVFVGAQSGMITEDDVNEAGNALEPGTVAALLIYENTWAIPFVAAARSAGGQVVAAARIPADVVIAALDAIEEAN